MASDSQLTPMMAQYRRIKSELPKDALLLFRLGDFYELFFEDAQTGAQLLNVALTHRGAVPMCGIPFHAANAYIGRLLKAGRKVAVCDQMEDARPGQLVKRAVTQILSPGTHFDERMLKAERNNFLAAVYALGKTAGLAVADLTTGEFMTTELALDSALPAELERLRPAEIIYPQEAAALRELLGGGSRESNADHNDSSRASTSAAADSRWILSGYDDWVFAPETARFTVRDHFKVASLDGFGLKDRSAAIGAAGAILHYLTQHLRRDVANLTRLSFYQRSDFLALDNTTLRHLEILEPLHPDAARASSLYGALNGHADGGAPAARLAVAAARDGGTDPAPAGSGAVVSREPGGFGKPPRTTGARARSGANGGTIEFRDGQCTGSHRAAAGARTDSRIEEPPGSGGASVRGSRNAAGQPAA